MATVCGIDVGIGGALAIFEVDTSDIFAARPRRRVIDIADMPTLMEGDTREVDGCGLREFLGAHRPDNVYIERVRAMPSIPGPGGLRRSMGSTSAFNFGGTYLATKTVVRLLGIPYTLIEPQQWKKRFGLRGSDKEQGRQMALRLMPEADKWMKRKLDHNRADALLLAIYGAEQVRDKRRAAAMMEDTDGPVTRTKRAAAAE